MSRKIIPIRSAKKTIDKLIAKNKLLSKDYEEFVENLRKNPELGDLIPGLNGIRKTRLKSASKGKRGGFRVCYFDYPLHEELFLILIYAKNDQEDISESEKRDLKEIIKLIREKA